MTIEQIGSIGELVAAVATVATLAYLASQIRQSTRASRGAGADRSSTNSIQIQRGIGTSTNGAAAFGATVNLSSKELDPESFASYTGGFGSFNTRKSNLKMTLMFLL